MAKYISTILLSLLLCPFLMSNSFAQKAGKKETKKNKESIKEQDSKEDKLAPKLTPEPVIKTGVIASTAQSKNSGSVSIGAVTDEQNTFGEKVAISGGVQNNSGKCKAMISNANKDKSYKVRFKVKGTVNNKRAFSKSFSGRVKSSGQLVKEFSCKSEAVLQLELLSAKPLQ